MSALRRRGCGPGRAAGFAPRVAAFAVLLAVAGVPEGALGQQPGAAAGSDSLRLLVLERLRGPVAPDTTAVDTIAADTAATAGGRAGGAGTAVRPPSAPPVPSGADDVMRALLGLDGFTPSTYEADRADFRVAERVLILRGGAERDARFAGQGTRIEADSTITYDETGGSVRTAGGTRFSAESGAPVESEYLIYSLTEERGTAAGAETTYGGGVWIVRGNLDSMQSGLLFGSATEFTTCELDHPHTHFQASQLKVVSGDWIVARSVTMYVDDVPILWLPFIAQNLGADRASGLLAPRFSVNDIVRTSSGYRRRISNLGYYWAINDYADALVALDWFSGSYTAVETRVGYRWARRFLNGNVNFRRYWQADGNRQLALRTNHAWQLSDRTSFSASGSYVSSSRFLRQNSFDPRESTQTVDSNASLARRFDWGRLNLGASRQQWLTDDRVEATFPSASLSLSTITLFPAPPQGSSWYNNLSLSGSANARRRLSDRGLQPDSTFQLSRASQLQSEADASGSLGLGDLRLSGRVNAEELVFREVPPGLVPLASGDVRSAAIDWSTSLGYQIGLIGSTTLTPSVSLGGRFVRTDSISEAREFVAGPTRWSMGLGLRTDLYGFYRGFGPFDAIRHKLSPGVSWSYAPRSDPTALQVAVFGSRVAERRSSLGFNLSQTWEARMSQGEEAPEGPAVAGAPGAPAAPAAAAPGGATGDAGGAPPSDGGPQRPPPSSVVTLLALQTSAIAYDVVRADSTGRFLDGFTTLTLSNSVGSDYLRGLNLSFTHDLFDDSAVPGGGARRFAPHLSQLSMNFSLGSESGIVRTIAGWLGASDPGASAEGNPAPAPTVTPAVADTVATGISVYGTDANRVIPGERTFVAPTRAEGWNANFSYSLRRPRLDGFGGTAQMLTTDLVFAPTANWSVAWSTAFDLEAGRFSDHAVSLIRDLHEWEADFGFFQSTTGNWAFNFTVSLRANRDLHFDYDQRSQGG